jgi:hypothetical protein
MALKAEDFRQPPDGTKEFHGLPTQSGFLCHFDTCNFRTTSMDTMRQYYNQKHQWYVDLVFCTLCTPFFLTSPVRYDL